MPDLLPDALTPIWCAADGVRQLELIRWGMPGPQ